MPQPPNIVFFFTDDQRFDTIAALGNEHIITPTLDSLVRDGVTFTSAYIMGGTSGAVCMPSRAMLHTGRTLFHIEVQGQAIPTDHTTMGECFQQAGYETFGTGKWHNGTESYARSFTAGAEIFFGGMDDHWNVPAHDFDPDGKYESRLPRCKDAYYSNELEHRHADHITAGKHSSELFAEATVDFLKSRDDERPFFAYVSFMAPHDPRTMPKQYLDMYDPADIPLPESFMPRHPFDNGDLKTRDERLEAWPRTPDAIRRHIAEYYAMITHADAEIGKVIDTLKQTGQYENTIIVFAGDNGLALGKHGLMGKQSIYEHSVHVPLVMAGPGVPKGERTGAFCYLIDIFPTLCELTRTPIPSTVEGQTLVPAMRDADEMIRDTLILAYTHIHRGARDKRWKLIEYAVGGVRTTQLFDLENDPHELTNLADDPARGEQVERLRGEVARWRDEMGDTCDDFWEVVSIPG